MTPLFLYNTLSDKKEKFNPAKKIGMHTLATKIKNLTKTTVTMYTCGPTVYDYAHIGNFRTFVMSDIVRRVFEYKGYIVEQAMNITDVDDKTIHRSHEKGISLKALTAKYEELFWKDMDSLNILRPKKILSARSHVSNMIEMINVLIKKGIAYVAKDGVYVSVLKVKNYGELAHLKKIDLSQERISNDEYDKENPRDFAVWKFAEQSTMAGSSEAVWDAPFGKGRPGWHIECSAMAIHALGKTIDIHTGGVDLIFPHHTNEIAQSESATGKTFVHYWVHGAFMNVEDEKMAKSKGNFLKISDLIAEHISPIAFRYWLLTSHYRSQVNFSFEAVRAAQTALFKLCEEVIEWAGIQKDDAQDRKDTKGTESTQEVRAEKIKEYLENFDTQISDDFNMPRAIATLWKVVKDPELFPSEKYLLAITFDKVFGLRLAELSPVKDDAGNIYQKSDHLSHAEIPAEILALAEARQAARLERDFTKADALRMEIEFRGYHVKDTENGFEIA